MSLPSVLVVSSSPTNRLGLPRVPQLPPCRFVVVSNWDRAVSRAPTGPVRVVVTDSLTFTRDWELTKAALAAIDPPLVLVLGLRMLTRWARELHVETTDRRGYGPRLIEALTPVTA